MRSGGPQTNSEFIVAKTLGRLELAKNDSRVFLEVVSEDGVVTGLSFPTDCLKSLIMTLPQIMRRALRSEHGDDSLRLVYPAKDIRIEQSTVPDTLIATFATSDGFEISLGLTLRQLECFNIAAEEVERRGTPANILTSVN
jgi:hypothetical protein